jgi:hypothetical protein
MTSAHASTRPQSFSGQMNSFYSKVLLFVYFRFGTHSPSLYPRILPKITLLFISTETPSFEGRFGTSSKLSIVYVCPRRPHCTASPTFYVGAGQKNGAKG